MPPSTSILWKCRAWDEASGALSTKSSKSGSRSRMPLRKYLVVKNLSRCATKTRSRAYTPTASQGHYIIDFEHSAIGFQKSRNGA